MASAWDLFKIILIVQLFYASAITMVTYALPDDTLDYVDSFNDLAGEIDLASVSTDIQDSIESQLDIPVVELGSLVFYSGNILIDLMLNFFFAIPEMLGLLINGIMMLFAIDSYIFAQVQLLASVVVIVLYFIGVVQVLMNIRSQGSIV